MFAGNKPRRFGIVSLLVLMLASAVFADDKGDRLKAQHHIDYDVPLNEATFVATHNSFNNLADGYYVPNHNISLVSQLNNGARAINFDLHNYDDKIVLCHSKAGVTCSSLDRTFADGLQDVSTWLSNPVNADEVLVIVIQDEMTSDADHTAAATIIESFLDLIFTPLDYGYGGGCQEVPYRFLTKQKIRDARKNILLVAEGGSYQENVWRDYVWKITLVDYVDPKSPNSSVVHRYPHQWMILAEDRIVVSAGHNKYDANEISRAMVLGATMVGLDFFTTYDRRESTIWSWMTNEPKNSAGNENYAVRINPSSNSSSWKAVAGSNNYRYACQSRLDGHWRITGAGTEGPWSAGSTACKQLGDEYVFSVPTNASENDLLRHEMYPAGVTTVWMNYTDSDVEGKWVAGDFVTQGLSYVMPIVNNLDRYTIGFASGSLFHTLKIPWDTKYEYCLVQIRGASGGSAQTPFQSQTGGFGAEFIQEYYIGYKPGQIKPESLFGIIPGQKGTSTNIAGGATAGGGGGGGTALLLMPPDQPWHHLLVAGGGGRFSCRRFG